MNDLPQLHAVTDTRTRAVSCCDCRDSGMVTVWHSRHYTEAREGNTPARGRMYSAAVPCRCAAGDRWQHLGQRFDPNLMLPIRPVLALWEQWGDLVSFVAQLRPAGYCAEFAEHGGGQYGGF